MSTSTFTAPGLRNAGTVGCRHARGDALDY
jgi:hypothetical protein